MKKCFSIFFLILMFWPVSVSTEMNSQHDGTNASKIGKPGDPANVTRTIEIKVIDNRFLPSKITVMQDETIKFIIKNEGLRRHEMVIDTLENLKKHAKLMRSDPAYISDKPNHVDVLPREQKELIWHFTESSIVDFACGYPGHFKKMRGKIYVEKK
nr:cupredoxin domain-containing protein [Nitrosomonas nitrosa]